FPERFTFKGRIAARPSDAIAEARGQTIQELSLLENPGAEVAGVLVLAAGEGARRFLAAAVSGPVCATRAVSRVCSVVVAAVAGVQFPDHLAVALLVVAIIVIVVGAYIAGLFGALAFLLIGAYDGALHHFAAGGVDGMGDVGVQLGAAV